MVESIDAKPLEVLPAQMPFEEFTEDLAIATTLAWSLAIQAVTQQDGTVIVHSLHSKAINAKMQSEANSKR